jgi:hypothetical protein
MTKHERLYTTNEVDSIGSGTNARAYEDSPWEMADFGDWLDAADLFEMFE